MLNRGNFNIPYQSSQMWWFIGGMVKVKFNTSKTLPAGQINCHIGSESILTGVRHTCAPTR